MNRNAWIVIVVSVLLLASIIIGLVLKTTSGFTMTRSIRPASVSPIVAGLMVSEPTVIRPKPEPTMDWHPPTTVMSPVAFAQILASKGVISQSDVLAVINHKVSAITSEIKKFIDKVVKLITDSEWVQTITSFIYYFPSFLWNALLLIPNSVVSYIKSLFKCVKMNGKVAVGFIFVESSATGGPVFSDADRFKLLGNLIKAQTFLSDNHPKKNLTWVNDFQFTKISVKNKSDSSATGSNPFLDTYWMYPGIGKIKYKGASFAPNNFGLDGYLDSLKADNKADYAIAYLVTPYVTTWMGYADQYTRRIVISNKDNYGGWGMDGVDRLLAHETCHLFGAKDEYNSKKGSPCGSCTSTHGCAKVANANCGSCNASQVQCIMNTNQPSVCKATQGQIGWIDSFIKVELTTSKDWFAGTNDDVWIKFGEKEYELDNSWNNDFESGEVNTFKLWDQSLKKEDLKKFTITLKQKTWVDDWKLQRIRIFYEDSLVLDQSPNRWFKKGSPSWSN